MLRGAKATGHIPIVFAGGLEEKVQRTREQLPEAIFTDWPGVTRALRKSLKSPPVPVLQKSYMQQYVGSSLVKKLGFKPGLRAVLLGAPDGFEEVDCKICAVDSDWTGLKFGRKGR